MSQPNKIAVIYKSKYGCTKRYAEWIAEKLGAEASNITKFDPSTLDRYSTVIFGSSVHIGKVKGIKFISDNWATLSTKQVIVFASTGAPKIEPKQNEVITASLPADMSLRVKYFPLPGAYCYSKLDFKDKMLMNLGPFAILRFNAWFKRDQKAKQQLSEMLKDQDWATQDATNPIVDYVKSAKN